MNDWYVFSHTTGCVEEPDLTQSEAAEICAELNMCDPDGQWDYAEDTENGETEEA